MDSLASIIWAIAGLVGAAAFFVGIFRGYKKLEAKVGNVHLVAEAVNAAVNNVEPGEPSLRSVVVQIRDRLDTHIVDTNSRLEKIEDHLTNPDSQVNSAIARMTEHVEGRGLTIDG